MSNTKQFLHLALSTILIVAGAAIGIHAQQRDPNQPRPTPTPKPITRVPGGVLTRDQTGARLSHLPGIYGTIRWKKELGLPYDPSSARPTGPVCSVFGVRLTVQEPGSPGTFGRTGTLDNFPLKGSPTQDGEYYVCSFALPDRAYPRNRMMVINADFWRSTAHETRPWKVGSNAQPPPGQQRAIIIIGGRNNGITLTYNQPHATVDFEMVYRPAPALPR